MIDDVEDVFPDEFHHHCHNCGADLPIANLSDMIESEIKFRQFFPRTWSHMPRIILCPKCYVQAKRDNPPPDWA